jgi:DNA repair exonuclease SbcCD ATPase subunit
MSSKLILRAVALLLLSLVLGTAQAETQVALVQRTFDALKQSAAALEQGDANRGLGLLESIKASAETLRATAERFGKQAAEAEKQREAEARSVTTQITDTYRAEQAADKEVGELTAKINDLAAQLTAANATRDALAAQSAEYGREVQIRRECLAQPLEGMFYSWACWRLSFQDVFASRWAYLKNDIEGNNAQRINIENTRRDLSGQLSTQQARAREASARKVQLESQRQTLEKQSKTLRAAVVSLSDASLFWTDTARLIDSKITSVETLQQNLQILVGRANKSSSSPVFDRYDKEEVRSLEATLVDFARTMDNQTNILLKP